MKTKILLLLLSIFTIGSFNQSNAQEQTMIGEVKMFAGNFAPRGWALCEGQLLPIAQYSALFSILGTTYGGDGRTTFALPDMRGRVAMGTGRGNGLSDSRLGEIKGQEQVTLTNSNLPSHSHRVQTETEQNEPVQVQQARDASSGGVMVNHPFGASSTDSETTNTGASYPVNNMQPSLSINYIICLEGVFPSRQ